SEIQPVDPVAQSVRVQPGTVAGRAQRVGVVPAEQDPHVHLVGAALDPSEPGAQSRVAPVSVAALPFQHGLALLGAQLAPGDVERNELPLGEADQHRALPLAGAAVPRAQRSLLDAQRVIGENLRPIDAQGTAEAAAGRTGPDRRLVAEEARACRLEATGAAGTHQSLP